MEILKSDTEILAAAQHRRDKFAVESRKVNCLLLE